ncbi:uncharacterized protein [Vulpes vulpes]|uniref:Uncharacterized protein n=1 Tax=Vulpes vulpes TaxID=9627 RepID=A0ABM5AS89_VULVU
MRTGLGAKQRRLQRCLSGRGGRPAYRLQHLGQRRRRRRRRRLRLPASIGRRLPARRSPREPLSVSEPRTRDAARQPRTAPLLVPPCPATGAPGADSKEERVSAPGCGVSGGGRRAEARDREGGIRRDDSSLAPLPSDLRRRLPGAGGVRKPSPQRAGPRRGRGCSPAVCVWLPALVPAPTHTAGEGRAPARPLLPLALPAACLGRSLPRARGFVPPGPGAPHPGSLQPRAEKPPGRASWLLSPSLPGV